MSDSITTRKIRTKKIDGVEFEYRLPTMLEQAKFGRKQRDLKDDFDNVELMIDFLVEMGLPRDKVELFDLEDARGLIRDMMPSEEKKS